TAKAVTAASVNTRHRLGEAGSSITSHPSNTTTVANTASSVYCFTVVEYVVCIGAAQRSAPARNAGPSRRPSRNAARNNTTGPATPNAAANSWAAVVDVALVRCNHD